MNQDQTYKNTIAEKIGRREVEFLRNGTMTEDEAAEISQYVLDNIIYKELNNAQVLDVLTDIVERWPIFSDILTLELGVATSHQENVVVQQAQALIKENRIDEALKVVEGANGQGGTQ